MDRIKMTFEDGWLLDMDRIKKVTFEDGLLLDTSKTAFEMSYWEPKLLTFSVLNTGSHCRRFDYISCNLHISICLTCMGQRV